MCFGGKPPSPPPPPRLAPPPPPPLAPVKPPPAPEPLITDTDVNPQVRRAKSKKAKSQLAKGTGQLRIPLDPKVSNPTAGPSGGLNT